ncbi:hypothetical protein BB561_002598 [Smittium simulii]|uniref:RNA helicase n=1 Tax=Smittium simulii TaxID=133385 RepID=A0A2T9YPW9_9FUNG|nr:hypothetical protein BB561_002598 [Smittium simulii]
MESYNHTNNKNGRNSQNKKILLSKQRQELPIYSARENIIQSIYKNDTTIVVGETGSGKTTQIPQYLLEAGFVKEFGTSIAVTQPRRVAATSIAKRVADEVGTRLGDKVGYGIRFDNCFSKYTKIKYLTDGMLLREVLTDPLLLKYKVVVLDEAHERTLRTDILFGMLKTIQKKREEMVKANAKKKKNSSKAHNSQENGNSNNFNSMPKKHIMFDQDNENQNDISLKNTKPKNHNPDSTDNDKKKDDTPFVSKLKIIIMSATLDAEKFLQYFNNAPVLYISGRQFPVKTFYTYEPQSDYLDSAHTTVIQLHLETNPNSGDILVFLSGQEDIENLEKLLKESNLHLPQYNKICTAPIYAALPQKLQNKVFESAPPHTRKIVLATNIAETSITIPGIKYVIDTGVHKSRGYDPRIGVESLLVEPISKSSARQRSGRAGRIDHGYCYRLYTEDDYEKLEENEVPEIKRRQLTSVILTLKAAGIDDILRFDYMDAPSKPAIKSALLELYALEALDESGNLSKLGSWMAEFPLDPVYSKVLYESVKHKCTSEALDLVAAHSVESIFFSPVDKRHLAAEAHKQFQSIDGDHWTVINLIKAFNEYKLNGTKVVIFDQDSADETPENIESEGIYEEVEYNKEDGNKLEAWCRKNFINFKNLNHVFKVRKQIENLCIKMGIDTTTSCGNDTEQVLICLLSGFFYKCAMLQPDGTYRSLTGSQTVHIHPSSTMFRKRASSIVYDQLVFTNKLYAKGVSSIQPAWISIASPRLYGNSNF